MIKHLLLTLVLSGLYLTNPLYSAWFDRLPYTVTQVDGSVIQCYVTGDEYFNWLHDEDGFTIIVGEDGFYYYAVQEGDLVVPGIHRVNSINPSQAGLSPWAQISRAEYLRIRDKFWEGADRSVRAPHTGTINNLVVYIRFSDQSEFTVPRSFYDARFNEPDGISLKNYFYEVSYEQLMIESHHFPITDLSTNLSYQDEHPRSYYEPYHAVNNPNGYQGDTQRRLREHTLLMNAINYIEDEVPVDLEIDGDGDGDVDNVCFIIRGNSGAWADLLWAHRWVLYSFDVTIHGKRVYDYTFQPESQNNTQTLCHEMFHVLGAPDLYHYTSNGIAPAGPWDIMEGGFGHMGAFMKYKYANQQWISEIPEITVAGTYTLNPLTSPENNAYKIASPNSSSQYFIVEYRLREGLYESTLPGDGLLVYRIDPNAGNGNAGGPPDEVYIYRPNGTTTNNGSVNLANFSLNVNRTEINDNTNPSSFLQNGSPGGLNIFNISTADETISFDILLGTEVEVAFEADATTILPGSFVQFADQTTNLPDTWEWSFPGGDPDTSNEQNPVVEYNEIGIYSVSLFASNNQSVDFLEKDNYIIVGTPEIQYSPAEFDLTMETNTSEAHHIQIHNSGDTWLRYHIDFMLDEESTSTNNLAGSILDIYDDIPANCSGITWAEGQLYMITFDGQLHIYDTLQASVINTYSIHSNAMSIVYDGEVLWIGKDDGVVHAYELDGNATGQFIELPSADMYTLAWDGEYIIANKASQINPLFYRFDRDGNEIGTYFGSIDGNRSTQLVWVPAHKNSHLWSVNNNKILRLYEDGNAFEVLAEFPAPSSLSYGLAHDGTDLWYATPMRKLYRIADGLEEWFFINWKNTLVESNATIEIPAMFNSKGLPEGIYEALVSIETNDYELPFIEIPVSLNVTIPTSIQEIQAAVVNVGVEHNMIKIDSPEGHIEMVELFDLTGKLILSKHKLSSNPAYIGGLQNNGIYLVRVTTPDQVVVRKVILL